MNDPIELYGHDLSALIFRLHQLQTLLQQHRAKIQRNGNTKLRRLSMDVVEDLREVGSLCLEAAGRTVSVPIIDPYSKDER